MSNVSIDLPLFTLMILIPIVGILYNKRKQLFPFIRKNWVWFATVCIVALIVFPLRYTLEIPFMQKESFSTPEAKNLFSNLLKNTYRAFDYREESDIYDKLAVSSSGDLLADVYLQTRKSMVIENQGGIRAKVQEVEVIDAEEVKNDARGLAYNCKWQVSGTVGHWGHIHRRTNQYEAIVKVVPIDGVWKMVGLDIIEEVRL